MQQTDILQKRPGITAKHTLLMCGVISMALYIVLATNSQQFAQAGFFDLVSVVFTCAGLSFIAWYHLHVSQDNKQFRADSQILYILVFAVIFRVIAYFIFPVLEDDFYRYLWDGYILLDQASPYLSAPSAYFGIETVPENMQVILDNINYPDIATVYGPLCQWIFGLAYLISPGELWPLKLIILIADLALLFIIILLMQAYSIKPHYLLLYAWSPLLIVQFVVSAHPDIISVLFIFLGLLARQRKAFFIMSISLALAAAVKIFAILLVPLLLGLHWKRWSVFLLTAVLIAWPLGVVDAWFPEGLKAMATQWYFNAPLYAVFSQFSFSTVKIGLLAFFTVLYSLGWRRNWWLQESELLRGDILFGVFLLILPALNTWYLVFILPFGVFYSSCTLWAASVLIFISYVFIANVELLNANTVLAAEFGVLLLVFVFDLKYTNRRLNTF